MSTATISFFSGNYLFVNLDLTKTNKQTKKLEQKKHKKTKKTTRKENKQIKYPKFYFPFS